MENQIIIGIKLTDKIQQHLDQCLPTHESYFKDNDPDFLKILHVNGERILGKTIQPGTAVAMLDDYSANIRSIFRKICPECRLSDGDIRIFAQTLIG